MNVPKGSTDVKPEMLTKPKAGYEDMNGNIALG